MKYIKNFTFGYLSVLLVFFIGACKEKTTGHVRILSMEGAYNVRDLGGYSVADNKTVKWGKVLRSGDLNHLTNKDLSYLKDLNLHSIIDFRSNEEVGQAPDKTPESLKHSFHIPIDVGNVFNIQSITKDAAELLLVEGNKLFINNFQDEYREFFRILQDSASAPLLFHCSAGKDRTGLGAALFLASLGVNKQTIIDDYMLSAELVKEKYQPLVDKNPLLEPIMTVKPEYIEAAFDEIERNYGGLDIFLTECLRVDIALMRRLYTE
jgi:protein-tyrosine phosphatase